MIDRILILLLFATALAASPARADTASVQTAWRLLDYIAVDYQGAVRNGKVVSKTEFTEMTEFAASAHKRIAALPASHAKADLQRRAVSLQTLIAGKAPAATVAATARALAADLIKAHPVPLAPAQTPVFDRGQALFTQNCASCHGLNGDGKGPASVSLQPPPTAFADKDRARERSVFAFYQVLEQGIEGTSMASFAGLPPQDRWDVALYASAFAYPTSAAAEGERIWKGDAPLRARINMENLIGMTPASLANEIGEAKADAVTAYLRRNPAAVLEPTTGPLTLARTRLDEALAAYAKGDRKGATDLALSAYLDGFEPVEPILSARDNALMIRLEGTMGALRAGIANGLPLDEVRRQVSALDALFTDAKAALAPGETSAGASFFGAFTVPLREGLEAILIVVAMLAFLRKVDRSDALPYVHWGWVAALVAGGLTWFVATYFIGISGASRELTEGFGSVFAAIVLLWVGVWMHGKSSATAWQCYICDKLNHALNRRSAWFLFGLSFLVVYREVFETILFYAAIWNHGNGGAVLAGGAAAAIALLIVAWMMMRYSRTLPIGKFFSYSSVLIAVLAVVLIGKGVAALQEAGYLPVHPLANLPRIQILGLFPTREGIIASLEEEDGRIYCDFAEAFRGDYAAAAELFTRLADEESQHRHRLLDLYRARFGEHLPLLRRQDVRGFRVRRPVWLGRALQPEKARREAAMMELETRRFYEAAARRATDAGVRQLLGDLARKEQRHEAAAADVIAAQTQSGATREEHATARRLSVLRIAQPGLAGLMDGSVSTLAPLFAAAFATSSTTDAFRVGLAASIGAGISMGFAEALSDDGKLSGRGGPWLRGVVCGLMTTLGGIGHTLPYLLGNFHAATVVAISVVVVELAVISWVRHRYMDAPPLSAAVQVGLGGALVFLTGWLIGTS